jgi:hypothetical protein
MAQTGTTCCSTTDSLARRLDDEIRIEPWSIAQASNDSRGPPGQLQAVNNRSLHQLI